MGQDGLVEIVVMSGFYHMFAIQSADVAPPTGSLTKP